MYVALSSGHWKEAFEKAFQRKNELKNLTIVTFIWWEVLKAKADKVDNAIRNFKQKCKP
nr:hypothetical protein [Mycoplasmopsis bovis]